MIHHAFITFGSSRWHKIHSREHFELALTYVHRYQAPIADALVHLDDCPIFFQTVHRRTHQLSFTLPQMPEGFNC